MPVDGAGVPVDGALLEWRRPAPAAAGLEHPGKTPGDPGETPEPVGHRLPNPWFANRGEMRVAAVAGQDLPPHGVGGLVTRIRPFDDAARLPEPGEDFGDLRTVALGGDLGGKEDRDHVIFGRRPQQAHPSLSGPGAPDRDRALPVMKVMSPSSAGFAVVQSPSARVSTSLTDRPRTPAKRMLWDGPLAEVGQHEQRHRDRQLLVLLEPLSPSSQEAGEACVVVVLDGAHPVAPFR